MSGLRLLGFGVVSLHLATAMAAPHRSQDRSTSTTVPAAEDPTKIELPADPPRSKAPTVAAVDPPSTFKDTQEKHHPVALIAAGAVGAAAGAFAIAGIGLIENANINSGGALATRQRELDASYAMFGIAGVLAIADVALVIIDVKRSHEQKKAQRLTAASSGSVAIRF
jgi:hypothetical protein